VKVAGRWTYLYRAIDQHGQVIDVLVSQRRDARAARTFFTRALTHGPSPVEVPTDRALVYPRVIDELVPAARQVTEQYSNNSVEADHGRLKARVRPVRGLKTISSLRVIVAGHALVQNLRRGHYEVTADVHVHDRVRIAFTELAHCLQVRSAEGRGGNVTAIHQRNSAAGRQPPCPRRAGLLATRQLVPLDESCEFDA
jgi:hypothetical protein